MTPIEDDLRRDLAADLALCETATRPPWEVRPEGGWEGDPLVRPRCIVRPRPDLIGRYPAHMHGEAFREDFVCPAHNMSVADLHAIAASRTAWPAAIRRALAAEALLHELLACEEGRGDVYELMGRARALLRGSGNG